MKIQIASDIHLEHYNYRNFRNTIAPSAPYLALLGDIGNCLDTDGNYEKFLSECSINFEHVFVIAGNHEYYGTTIEDGNKKMNSLCSKFKNVHYLNNSFFIIENFIVFGTTLWSNIGYWNKKTIQKEINDFKQITDLTVDSINKMHNLAIWNIRRLLEVRSENFVILTHHAPTFKETSNPKYTNSKTNEYFASNLEYIMKYHHDKLQIWAHGHTHWNNIQTIHNTCVCSNQHGYVSECPDYERNFILIDSEEKLKLEL